MLKNHFHRRKFRPIALMLAFSLLTLSPAASRSVVSSNLQQKPLASERAGKQAASRSLARTNTALLNLPLSFEPNQGQTDRKVKYLARGSGYTLFLTQTEATLALYRNEEDAATPMSGAHQTPTPSSKSLSSVVRIKLKGANPAPQV